jgi:PAS domain S-box-containing protein
VPGYALRVMPDWKWSVHPTYKGLIRAIEDMNCGMLVESGDGYILYANKRIIEWSGYTIEELEGASTKILIPPELHDALDDERGRTVAGDHRTRLSAFRRRDGRTFPVAVAPHGMQRLDTGEPAVIALLFELGEVQTARPLGAPEGSLAAELAGVALKLQSMTFTAAAGSEVVTPTDHPRLRELSGREKEVLEHLMTGSRVAAIASQLFISPSTVRNHLKSIYRKAGVSSQSELIELVHSLGRESDTADS